MQAIEAYKRHPKASVARTQRRLQVFEDRDGAWTSHYPKQFTAEDLGNGDLENTEWAGEAELLEGLEAESAEPERTHVQLP